jgi:hypothetical protein
LFSSKQQQMSTGFPGIGSPSVSQAKDFRDYGSYAANLPPQTIGTHGIPSTPYSKLPHAAWIPYFGIGNTRVQHDPYDSYDQEIRNFPDAYRAPGGREAGMYPNDFLDKLVIKRITQSQQYLITEVLPWQVDTTRMTRTWNVWRFNDHMLDRTPEQSVSRLLTSNQASFQAGLVRYGIALMLEHGFMKTAKGRKNYEMNIQQIVNATVMTLMKGAWVALLHVDHRNQPGHDIPNDRLDSKQEAEAIIQRELDYFGICGKGPNGFLELLEAERQRFLQRTGELPDYAICGRGTLRYANQLAYHKYYFPMTGFGVDENQGKQSMRKGGITVREAPTFNLGGEHKNIAPAEQDKCTTNFLTWFRGNAPVEDFKTAAMDIRTYDYDQDKQVELPYMRALWCTAWFKKSELPGGGPGSGDMPGENAMGNFGTKYDDLNTPGGKMSSEYELSSLGKKFLARFGTWGKYMDACGIRERFIQGLSGSENDEKRALFYRKFLAHRKPAGLPMHQLLHPELSRVLLDSKLQRTISSFIAAIRGEQAESKQGQEQEQRASIQLNRGARSMNLGSLRLFNAGYFQDREDGRLAALPREESLDQKDGSDQQQTREVPASMANGSLRKLFELGFEEVMHAIYSRRVGGRGETGVTISADDFEALMTHVIAAYNANLKDKDRKGFASLELSALLSAIYEGTPIDVIKRIAGKSKTDTIKQLRDDGALLAAVAAELNETFADALASLQPDAFTEFARDFDDDEKLVPKPDKMKSIDEILDMIPITEADIVFFAARENLEPLVEVVGFRNIEWRVSPLVMLKAYGKAGVTWQGEHSFELGDDPIRKVHFGHFTLYATSVVFEPNLVQHAHAVTVHRYLRGGGTRMWDFNRYDHNTAFNRAQKIADIICYGVIPGDERLYAAKRLDMTGWPHSDLAEIRREQGGPLPREAPIYAERLHLKHPPKALILYPFLEQTPYYQTMAFQAFQVRCTGKIGKGQYKDEYVLNQGHEGPDFGYEGSIRVFNGNMSYLSSPFWSPLSHRQNIVSTGLATSVTPYTF